MAIKKRLAALGAAMVMGLSMMSLGASASTPYYWTLKKSYNQPTSKVKCSGVVTNLTAASDDAIDFYCSSMSNTNANVKFAIEASFRRSSKQRTRLYYTGDSDTSKFKSNWYTDSKCSDGKCSISGTLENDTSTTYTAKGSAK